jgi:hypothetical protein
MATITITDIDRRNLSLTYNDGVITTTYTILKYTCSLEQDANTIHLRWRNDATDSRLYFSLEWSEVTSPVTVDADALKVLLLQYLASCDQPRNVVTVTNVGYVVLYDDSTIICQSGCTSVDLLLATNQREIRIVNNSGGGVDVRCAGSDEIDLKGSLSSFYSLSDNCGILLVPDGVDKYYAVSNYTIQG